jgi:hypothetical protein
MNEETGDRLVEAEWLAFCAATPFLAEIVKYRNVLVTRAHAMTLARDIEQCLGEVEDVLELPAARDFDERDVLPLQIAFESLLQVKEIDALQQEFDFMQVQNDRRSLAQ